MLVIFGALTVGGGLALLIWALGNNLDGFKLPRDLVGTDLALGDQVSVADACRWAACRPSATVSSTFTLAMARRRCR